MKLDDRCPRCSGSFHCGATDAHCDCFDLKLSDALREQLKKDYEYCLCVACLRELARQEAEPSSSHPTGS
ncbi:MAG TPA: cysteine-rich CWC family protein [Burkholderiaceae bacterium]